MNNKQKLEAEKNYRAQLDEFVESEHFEKTFGDNPNKLERAILHELADEMNLLHFTEGDRKIRALIIRKHPPLLPFGCFAPDHQKWTTDAVLQATALGPLEKLFCITINVLFDSEDITDLVCCATRWPILITYLGSLNADMIALQEVTPEFYELLLSQLWVRQNYYVSDVIGESINPHGNFYYQKYHFTIVTFIVFRKALKKQFCHLIILMDSHL